eukprot:scaffold174344_cov32-Tisochrysis_lutea.AAC.7
MSGARAWISPGADADVIGAFEADVAGTPSFVVAMMAAASAAANFLSSGIAMPRCTHDRNNDIGIELERRCTARCVGVPIAPGGGFATRAAAKLNGSFGRGVGVRSSWRRGQRSYGPKTLPWLADCGGGTWYTRLLVGATGSAGRATVSADNPVAHWSARLSNRTYSGALEEKDVRCSTNRVKA